MPFLPFESLTSSSPTTMSLSYSLKRTVSIQRKKGLSRNAKLTFCEAELCLRSQYYLYLRPTNLMLIGTKNHEPKCDIKRKDALLNNSKTGRIPHLKICHVNGRKRNPHPLRTWYNLSCPFYPPIFSPCFFCADL